MDRARRIRLEAWEADEQMTALNESLERDDSRRRIAVGIALAHYASDDVEIPELSEENRYGADLPESVDSGYWVPARVWVDADAVEDVLNA